MNDCIFARMCDLISISKNMSNPKKYILFCAQEANFQTRSILIPYDQIMQCEQRVRDLQLLQDNSLKNVIFKHKHGEYIVDNLLLENLTWEGNLGYRDQTVITNIINDFMFYADRPMENCLVKDYDSVWTDGIICGVASKGFNHFVNYCDFRNKKKYQNKSIDIVLGFLVLQTEDGQLNFPLVETVEEMYQMYFSEKKVPVINKN